MKRNALYIIVALAVVAAVGSLLFYFVGEEKELVVVEGLVLEVSTSTPAIALQTEEGKTFLINLIPKRTELLDEEKVPAKLSYLKRGFAVRAEGTMAGEGRLEARRVSVVATSVPVEYTNPYFKISLRYRSAWIPDRQASDLPGVPLRFKGDDGFFGVDALGGSESFSLKDAVGSLAFHVLRPYGRNPKIVEAVLHDEEASFILPSEDQSPEANQAAAFVVKYPAPVKIGDNIYFFFVLYADQPHIQGLVETLKFL